MITMAMARTTTKTKNATTGASAKLDAGTASYSILSVQLYENYSCNASIAGAACTTVTGIPPRAVRSGVDLVGPASC